MLYPSDSFFKEEFIPFRMGIISLFLLLLTQLIEER